MGCDDTRTVVESVRHDRKVGRDIFISYEAMGDVSNPAIVMIPGLGSQLLAFPEAHCKKLAEMGYYVIRMDNRDVGHSTHLDHCGQPNKMFAFAMSIMGRNIAESAVPFTLRDMAMDVIGLLDKLKVEKAHMLGASMGGMIAQEVALNWPDRCLSLVPVMSSPGGQTESASIGFYLNFLQDSAHADDIEGRTNELMKDYRLLANGEHFDLEETAETVRARLARSTYKEGASRQLVAVLQANSGVGRQERLKGLSVPALVIHGARDPLIPVSNGKLLAGLIQGSRIEILEEMGHDLQSPSMSKVTALLGEWKESYLKQ